MKEVSEFEINKQRENNRIKINDVLLGICFTLFTFLIALNPKLLKENLFLTLQLVCAIPFLMSSLLARTKASYNHDKQRWKDFGFYTYLLGYSFLLNVVGIFLISSISFWTGIIFFAINIFLALVYSAIEISYDKTRFNERLVKDIVFIIILILLGILPAMGIY